MITEKDLYKGLQVKSSTSIYTIYNDECTKIKGNDECTKIKGNDECTKIKGNDIYSGYSKKDICQYINDGDWIIINPINKIYELW